MLKRKIMINLAFFAIMFSMLATSAVAMAAVPKNGSDSFDISKAPVEITESGNYTITGTSEKNTITIKADSTVTIEDLAIDISKIDISKPEDLASVTSPIKIENCNVTLILKGTNTLVSQMHLAGIEVNRGSAVVIKGDGQLSVENNWQADDYRKNATGAAIGSSEGLDSGSITIESGQISTQIRGFAAGIGSGYLGNATKIMISGGTVEATTYKSSALDSCGAAIGSGCIPRDYAKSDKGDGGEIIINGTAQVTAQNGVKQGSWNLSDGSAAIGGAGNKGANITIGGKAKVDANNRGRSAAIGAGIGSAKSKPNPEKNTIHITDEAVVNATAEAYLYDWSVGAAIGNPTLFSANQPMDIIIDKDARVLALSDDGAGIGCGVINYSASVDLCGEMSVVIKDRAKVGSSSRYGNAIGMGLLFRCPAGAYKMKIQLLDEAEVELESNVSQAIGDVYNADGFYSSLADPTQVEIANTVTLKAYSNSGDFAIQPQVKGAASLLNICLQDNDIYNQADLPKDKYPIYLVSKSDYSLLNTLNMPTFDNKQLAEAGKCAGYQAFAGSVQNQEDVFVVNSMGTKKDSVNCGVYKATVANSDTYYRYQGENKKKDKVVWELYPTIQYLAGENGTVSCAGEIIDKYHFKDAAASGFVGSLGIANGGYAFKDWTNQKTVAATKNPLDKATADSFVFDKDGQPQSTVFTANFEKNAGGGAGGGGSNYCTLTYDSNGGTTYPSQGYARSTIVKLDQLPIREGYVFTGWYKDAALTQKITEVQMNGSKTVYAGWKVSTVPDILNGSDHFAYVVGYTDDTVRPLAKISRAEVATIFFRLLNDEVRKDKLTSVNNFEDIQSDQWHNTPISTLAALGILKGYDDANFAPNALITRGEFAAICARFDTGVENGSSNFNDIQGHWAKAEIQRATALGWLQGYPDGSFRPNQPISRAEAMSLLNRVLNRHVDTSADLLKEMKQWADNLDTAAWYYFEVQEATNSHNYTRKADGKNETWTSLRPNKDWTKEN